MSGSHGGEGGPERRTFDGTGTLGERQDSGEFILASGTQPSVTHQVGTPWRVAVSPFLAQ